MVLIFVNYVLQVITSVLTSRARASPPTPSRLRIRKETMTDKQILAVLKECFTEVGAIDTLDLLAGDDMFNIIEALPIEWLRKRIEETDAEWGWSEWLECLPEED